MDTDQRETTISLRPDEATRVALEMIAKAAAQPRLSDEHVWLSMWTCVANCFNCQDAAAAARWADKGLQQFRDRFAA